MLPEYDLLVPARRSTTWAALLSGAFQTHAPRRIIVLDTADRPLTSRYEFRMAADIIVERGTEFIYVRERHHGICAARVRLGDLAGPAVLGWLDDDCILEPHAAERALPHITKFGAVACRTPTPNNEYESPVWEPPQEAPPPFSYGPALDGPVEDWRCGFGSAFITWGAWPTARTAILDPDTEDGKEDRAVWKALGGVMVAPDAFSWEMKHSESRIWTPYLEALS